MQGPTKIINFLILSLFITLAINLSANNKTSADLQTKSEENTTSYFSNISPQYREEFRLDSIISAYHKAIEQCDGDLLASAKENYNFGVILDENGDIKNAISHLEKALETGNNILNDSIIAEAANYLGGIYWVEGDCSNSTKYYELGLISAERCQNSKMICIIKMNLSGNFNSSGKTEKAIQFALEALEVKEKDNNTNGICYDYVVLGEIFQSIGNIEKWESYLQKAYHLKDQPSCAGLTDIVMIYNNLGRLSEVKEEYDAALAYYDTIIQISKPEKYDQGVGIALLNSALVHQLQDDPSNALDLAIKSEQYLGDVPYFRMAVSNVKAEMLHLLKRNIEALELVNENIQNENMSLYPDIKQSCLSLLYKINYELKNYSSAYNWNDTLRTYEAHLSDEESIENIEELETKYQTEKKEQQIELLSAENQIKKQRVVLFVATSISLLLVLVVGFMLYYRNKKQQLQKQESLRQQLLRSQMNPHFLFNALGSIQNYMLNNDSRQAAGYLNNFASLTRAILEHSAMETVMLDDEIEALHNYIKLEQMRLQHSFNYSINFDDDLESEFIQIPPMLIQPFVENAVKHGLKNKAENGELIITIKDHEEALKVSITDNGKGFDTNSKQPSTHKSMAMDIFTQRINLLKKTHRKMANYTIESSKEEGTKVIIDIPIIN